jgi:hypothetical protein
MEQTTVAGITNELAVEDLGTKVPMTTVGCSQAAQRENLRTSQRRGGRDRHPDNQCSSFEQQ